MSQQLDHIESSEARAEALESGCALPLISRGRTLGVLTLASRIENSFSLEDVDFLRRVAGQIAIAVENALAYREIAELKDKLAQEKLYLEDELRGEMDYEGIVGQSSALRNVLSLVETVAPSDSTVLLLGETGTGKELIARAIHERSKRKERTFVKLNCAAIPTGLLESELLDMNGAPSPARLLRRSADWNWPTKAHCSSTRLEIFRSRFSRSSCGLCRSVSLKGWAAIEPRRSMCDW
jgi:transcriptional regulator with GAF, ATPase, and Fis domain